VHLNRLTTPEEEASEDKQLAQGWLDNHDVVDQLGVSLAFVSRDILLLKHLHHFDRFSILLRRAVKENMVDRVQP
jgi:hypothetical protein